MLFLWLLYPCSTIKHPVKGHPSPFSLLVHSHVWYKAVWRHQLGSVQLHSSSTAHCALRSAAQYRLDLRSQSSASLCCCMAQPQQGHRSGEGKGRAPISHQKYHYRAIGCGIQCLKAGGTCCLPVRYQKPFRLQEHMEGLFSTPPGRCPAHHGSQHYARTN